MISRRHAVVEAGGELLQVAVELFGYAGAEVAGFWGVRTSAVNRAAGSAGVAEIGKYL